MLKNKSLMGAAPSLAAPLNGFVSGNDMGKFIEGGMGSQDVDFGSPDLDFGAQNDVDFRAFVEGDSMEGFAYGDNTEASVGDYS